MVEILVMCFFKIGKQLDELFAGKTRQRTETFFAILIIFKPFKGNPAGVMIVTEDVSSELMQNIALEMNLSETAFIFPRENDFQIRYFTPTMSPISPYEK